MAKEKLLEKVAKVADKITPIPLPTRKNRNIVKKGLRKFDNYMYEKFPNAKVFNVSVDKKMNDINKNIDDYMKENFPKTREVVGKLEKVFKSKGGRVNLRGGGMCKKGMNKKARGANS
jgi:hypothetical protein